MDWWRKKNSLNKNRLRSWHTKQFSMDDLKTRKIIATNKLYHTLGWM